MSLSNEWQKIYEGWISVCVSHFGQQMRRYFNVTNKDQLHKKKRKLKEKQQKQKETVDRETKRKWWDYKNTQIYNLDLLNIYGWPWNESYAWHTVNQLLKIWRWTTLLTRIKLCTASWNTVLCFFFLVTSAHASYLSGLDILFFSFGKSWKFSTSVHCTSCIG